VAAAATALAAVAIGARAAGVGDIEFYPRLELTTGPAEAALAGAVVLLATAPFAGPSARLGVARG
jgi:hypothetical protein